MQNANNDNGAMNVKHRKSGNFFYKNELEQLVKNMKYDLFEKDELIEKLNRSLWKWQTSSYVSWFAFIIMLIVCITLKSKM